MADKLFDLPEGAIHDEDSPRFDLPEGAIVKESLGSDVAKSIGSRLLEGVVGTVGGIGDIRNLMKAGSAWAATHLGASPESVAKAQETIGGIAKYAAPGFYFAPSTRDIQQTLDLGRFQHEPQTALGSTLGSIAGFVPGALTGGAGTARGLLADVGRFAVAPGLATEGASHVPYLDNPVGETALALLASHGASRAITPRPSGPSGPPATSMAHQESVNALDRMNPPVPMSPGERFNDQAMRVAESERNPERYLANREISTLHSLRAVGEEIGNPNAFTNLDQGQGRVILRGEPNGYPGTVGAMLDTIGGNINHIVGQHNMMADTQLGRDLSAFRREYRYSPTTISDEANRAADRLGDLLVDSRQPGQPGHGTAGLLSGRDAQDLRSYYNRIARGTEDPQRSEMLHRFSHLIDDALDRSVMAQNPGNLGILQANRAAYRAAQVIEKATSAKAGPQSINHITPAALEAAAKSTYDPRWHARGQDPFHFAPHMAKVLVTEPNSQTARRLKTLMGALPHAASGVAGGLLGGYFSGHGFHDPLSLQLLGEVGGPALGALATSLMVDPTRRALARASEPYRSNQLLAGRPGVQSIPGLLTTIQAARQAGIPQFAQGGIITQPTIGMVGESGPEAIVPLSQDPRGPQQQQPSSFAMPASADTGMTFTAPWQPQQPQPQPQPQPQLQPQPQPQPQQPQQHQLGPGGGKGGLMAPQQHTGGFEGLLYNMLQAARSSRQPTWGMPMRAFAEGGIVDRPTVGLLGENGPEMVVPLGGGGGPSPEQAAAMTHPSNLPEDAVQAFARKGSGLLGQVAKQATVGNFLTLRDLTNRAMSGEDISTDPTAGGKLVMSLLGPGGAGAKVPAGATLRAVLGPRFSKSVETHPLLNKATGEMVGSINMTKTPNNWLYVNMVKGAQGPGQEGFKGTREMLQSVREHYPDVRGIGGFRVSGGRGQAGKPENDYYSFENKRFEPMPPWDIKRPRAPYVPPPELSDRMVNLERGMRGLGTRPPPDVGIEEAFRRLREVGL